MTFFKGTHVQELIEFLKNNRVQKFTGLGMEVEFFPDYESVLNQSKPTADQLKYFAVDNDE